jgi:hypothetical protein
MPPQFDDRPPKARYLPPKLPAHARERPPRARIVEEAQQPAPVAVLGREVREERGRAGAAREREGWRGAQPPFIQRGVGLAFLRPARDAIDVTDARL